MDFVKEGIGDLYHQETKYQRGSMDREGLNRGGQSPSGERTSFKERKIPLHSIEQEGGKSLWETIARRRSVRDFSSRGITFGELSQLLWATQGITAKAWGYGFRACPSAGALYPVETYIIANRVEGILPGLYHYDLNVAELVPVKEGNLGYELSRAGLDQEMLGLAACVFVWTAVVERSKRKYRERAYRYIYMDVGHIGQNLYLAATGLNLGCCTVGAFFDGDLDRLIGVDGKNEISVYMGAVGHVL